MKKIKKKSTENCHFYSLEILLYIAWACLRNVLAFCNKSVTARTIGTLPKNKNIYMSSFKSSGSIQNKDDGPDRPVSNNLLPAVTLNELAMEAR